VQTNDDNIEKEIQTEETTNRDKWTQHPAGVDVQPFGGWRTLSSFQVFVHCCIVDGVLTILLTVSTK